MKKFILLLVVIILALTTVGCVEIRVSREMRKDASVVDRVEIVLDEEILLKNGYSLTYAKEVAEELLTANGYTIVEGEDSVVTGEIVYSTLEEFREVYGEGDSDEGLSEGFLFDSYGNATTTPFASILNNGLDKMLKDTYFPLFDDQDLEDVTYSYVYSTTYKSIESDAVIKEEDGYYVHQWTFTPTEARYGTIYISQTIPNTTGWYFLAIVVALLIVAIGYAVVYYKAKKKSDEEDSYGE